MIMGKKDKRPKKVNPKKEKYAKFRKEKPAALDLRMPELTAEQQKEKQDAELKLGKFLRFNRNPPAKEISERKMKSKR